MRTRDSSGDGEKMEPLGTQRDYVSQRSPGGCACARQGWLEGGRGGKRKEGGWPERVSELAAAALSRAVAREGLSGDATGVALYRAAWLPAERAYCRQKGSPGTVPCPSLSPRLSVPAVVRSRPALGQRCLCVLESLPCPGACRHRGAGKAGLEGPTPALLKQNNVRFLPLCFFSRRHRQSPNLGETESSL